MKSITSRTWRRWAVAAGVLLTSAVVAVAPAAPVDAVPVWPLCLGDDDDDTDVDCLPYSDTRVKPVIIGVLGQGNLTIRSSFKVPACDLFTATRNCYFTVGQPRFDDCYYIDIREDDPTGVESCGGIEDMYLPGTLTKPVRDYFSYTSGTATSFGGTTTQLGCSGRYDTVFAFGGDQRTDFVWRTRGPVTANCDVAVDLPVPNKLQGPTFMRVTVSGRVCAADSGTNCSSSETATGYAWLPVFGTLDPALEGEVDPPQPDTPPEDDEEPLEPVEPSRISDSRDSGDTVDGEAEGEGLVEAGTSRQIAVTGRAGVPDDAKGVVLNVTTVGADAPGFVTLYPCDEDVPSTSSVNFGRGQVVANSTVVKLSGDGDICVFASTDVHVLVDTTGYVGDDGSITTIVPTRLVETREGKSTDDGDNEGTGQVEAGEPIEVQIAGRGGVPDDAEVVVANLTMVRPEGRGFATMSPCGEAPGEAPSTSSVNFEAGQVRANSSFVPLSEDGTMCIYTSARSDLILDITAAVGPSADFAGVEPARLLDTRSGFETVDNQSEGSGKLEAGETIEVKIAGRGGVPADADVVTANITAVAPDGKGFVSVLDAEFGCDLGGAVPSTSTLNFDDVGAKATANGAMMPLSSSGTVCVYAHESTHVLIDVATYGTDDDPRVVVPPNSVGPYLPPDS